MKKVLILLALLALSLPLVGALYQWWHNRREAHSYPPEGKRIDIGGYKLHLYATGDSKAGIPSVVLDAGSGGTCLSWCKVQPALETITRVCSFDRAGMGWSDAGPTPRTSQRIADELHTLLHKANIPAPYLLVGHSFGGMNMRVFAASYAREVAGLVLVDAPNEEEIEHLPDSAYATAKQYIRRAIWYLAAVFGLIRLAIRMKFIAQDMSEYPQHLRQTVRWLYSQPRSVKTRDDEELVAQTSCAQVRATRSYLKNVPLVVISSGKKGIDSPLMAYQRELAKLSTCSKHVIALHSGHLIQFDQPELVIQMIRELLLPKNTSVTHENECITPPSLEQAFDVQHS